MRRSACVVALCAAGVLAGCGSSSSNSSSSSTSKPSTGGGSFTVSESEFKITPKDNSVAAGTIMITAHNTGKIIHALAVRTLSGVVKTPPIQPGASATLTVNLTKAGSYKLFCPIDGHASLGMVGILTVGGGSAGGGGAASTTTTHPPSGY